MSILFKTMVDTGFYDECIKNGKVGVSRMFKPKFIAPVYVKILDRVSCVPKNAQYPNDAIFVSLGYCIDGVVEEAKLDVVAICPDSTDVLMVSAFGGDVLFYLDDGSLKASKLIAYCFGHLRGMIEELDVKRLMLSLKHGCVVNTLAYT